MVLQYVEKEPEVHVQCPNAMLICLNPAVHDAG